MRFFPGIKVGDIVNIDDENLECSQEIPNLDAFWFVPVGVATYYYMRWWDKQELEKMFHEGRLTIGRKVKETGGSPTHWHTWSRYVGLNKVVDVCSCGAEKPVDWKEAGDADRKT